MKKRLIVFLLLVILGFGYHYLGGFYKANVVSNANNLNLTGEARLYPNPSLTPGDVLSTDANTVCVSGYTATVRDVSDSLRKQVFAEYEISYPQPTGSIELDHFISLELGGSNDIKNLWPEPAEPRPGFHEKDAVENYLHKKVCDGEMTLEEAQKEIREDWYKVYLEMQ